MEQKMSQYRVERNLINETEAARALGLKVTTLRRWRWAGKGPVFHKIGSAVRYHPDDLTTFIDAARRNSTSDRGSEAEDVTSTGETPHDPHAQPPLIPRP